MTTTTQTPAQRIAYGIVGAWIASLAAMLIFSFKDGASVTAALVMFSVATGVLSSYLLNYGSQQRRNQAMPIVLLVLNGLLTAVGIYLLGSMLLPS